MCFVSAFTFNPDLKEWNQQTKMLFDSVFIYLFLRIFVLCQDKTISDISKEYKTILLAAKTNNHNFRIKLKKIKMNVCNIFNMTETKVLLQLHEQCFFFSEHKHWLMYVCN